MIKFMFAAFASLAMVACAPIATIASGPNCGLAFGTLIDEKALYGAETAYNVPANAYVTLDSQGLLNTATKEQVRPLLIKSYGALKLARAAYKAGDACGFVASVRAVSNFASQAKATLPH